MSTADPREPRYRRRVSPAERLYLAGARPDRPLVIQLVVEGRGGLDPRTLERAVARACAALPGTRLVRRGQWVDSGRTPPVRRVAASATGAVDPNGPDLRRELPPDTGPTCEVLLATDGAGTARAVVFRAFHGVMDGRGVLLWAAGVFRALRGEPVPPAKDTLTDDALAARLGAVGRRPLLGPRWRSPLGGGPRAAGPGVVLRRPVDGRHPGLVARVAAAVAAGHGPSRFMVPVDLRRHAPEAASTGNLALPVFLDGRDGEPWQAWHGRLLRALAERREAVVGRAERALAALPVVGAAALLGLADSAMTRTGRYLSTAIISHLGAVDPADYSGGGFTASAVFSLPVHSPLVPFSVVAVESPGRTELTLACAATAAGPAQALLERIADTLAPDPLRAWAGNRTDRPRRGDATLVGLFAEQVAAAPDAVALTGPDGPTGYAELDSRADAVAAELAARGVGRGDVVGLLADRSVEAVAGLWGILKAGAAYLPLDPRHPDARIGWSLADARAALCLVRRGHAARVPAHTALVLDDLPRAGARPAPADAAGPDDLAYVIYTSGSTGRPKGVQVEHRSVVSYVTWARDRYRVDADTRFALFTSLAFDLTGTALLLPLVCGGSVALVPGEVGPATLRATVEEAGVNALKLTPAHLDLICRLGVRPAGFRVLVVGGEQLRGPVAAGAAEVFGPDCRIVNEYGPTEATIGCVAHDFDPAREGDAPAVPIGAPVGTTRVFLLDAERRPVPAGAEGELYLSGAQLARGYLRRPEEDRERFVRLADGTRAYRTGDLARLRPEGVLEFLGRADEQVKIRGHRVEPGEVAAVLEEHPGIARAHVAARGGPGGRRVLCAYAVPRPGGAAPREEELRAHLAARLPAAMVPAALVCVPDLPRTGNGKIDTAALPDPFTGGRAETAAPSAPPVDGLEAEVAAVWARVLGTGAHGIASEDDFHRLGGDSLSLLEMVAAVAAEVPGAGRAEDVLSGLGETAANPTLADVCRAVRRLGGGSGSGGRES
ncbi:non-ribosomal peptide synthetase [Thermobifida halotolerans]|uniref:Non-ribosomal peptide synthetase n=1 Tax=Thermobifida halotolerans TaxID=483545 RepID=A0AA97LYX9_9ACTN|nr:non-ribosomal peptide synthetase [Thermobifida halotolerans]UOE20566.1 non-ribosomal peptide synthetase [Thermobifida halotolerans]